MSDTPARVAPVEAETKEKPKLVFFLSATDGRCRKVEAFLDQVLQHRKNHDTFTVLRVDIAERPDLARRFGVDAVPTFLVVEGGHVAARFSDPSGPRAIAANLDQWLR